MQLQEFNIREPSHKTNAISRVVGCRVLYVYDGRNAWHSTWVQRYRKGCFHTRLESAKEFCEKQRVQGSVFYIEELPALLIENVSGVLIVTQINCKDPLQGYSPDAVRSAPPDGKALIRDHQDNYLQVGIPMAHAALTFERDSRFWRTPPPIRNSLIMGWASHIDSLVMYAKAEGGLFCTDKRPPLLDGSALQGFTSGSLGSAYKLSWTARPSRAYQSGVMEIMRSLLGNARGSSNATVTEL